MKRRYILGVFILLAVVQLSVPGYMIAKRELTLRTGTQFKVAIAPVDPVDAFRGRYLAIRIKNNYVTVNNPQQLQRKEKVYASLEKTDQGWLRITELSTTQPTQNNYLQVEINYIRPDQNRVYLEFPFDRYYLPEEIAPVVEEKYRKLSNQAKGEAYITVRVKDGLGVIEELYLNDQPVSGYKN